MPEPTHTHAPGRPARPSVPGPDRAPPAAGPPRAHGRAPAAAAAWRTDPVVAALLSCLEAPPRPCGEPARYQAYVRLALSAYLAETAALAPAGGTRRGGLAPWQLQRAQRLLLEAMDGPVCLAGIAQACRLSVGHFARAFARDTGESPLRWLMGRRVERARDLLLAHPPLPIAEIAQRCGFADQSHLTRAFAARMGLAPAAWRRRHYQPRPVA